MAGFQQNLQPLFKAKFFQRRLPIKANKTGGVRLLQEVDESLFLLDNADDSRVLKTLA